MSKAEIEQLNQLVQLGALYKQIQTFVAKYSGISSKLALKLAFKDSIGKNSFGNGNDGQNLSEQGSDQGEQLNEDDGQVVGVYIKAFCSGVNDLLTVYKSQLLTLE